MKISIGYSPCPNDTFIFDALINGKIDTQGLDFVCTLADVEALNQMATQEVLDITKLSFNAFGKLTEKYQLLNAGSALGKACGPLLISKRDLKKDLKDCVVAIPGENTTANLLLSIALPEITNKKVVIFSEIEQQLLEDKVDLGLIIHENRFTYESKGLIKIIDLGEYWESTTGKLIPLGGISIRRSLDQTIKEKVDFLISESVRFAFENPQSGMDYIRNHAQEMDDSVINSHISLYVNEYSQNLGNVGKDSINHLLQAMQDLDKTLKINKPIYI